jgi:hypothetical protein
MSVNVGFDFTPSATYVPPTLSRAEAMAIVAKRRSGLYNTKETYDEALVSVEQLMDTPTDKVFTLVRSQGVMSVYNTKEFLALIKHWRGLKMEVLKCNIIPIKCGAYGDAWLMAVSPPEDIDCSLCPLAIAFSIMVNGYSYISKDRTLFDVAWSALGKHE